MRIPEEIDARVPTNPAKWRDKMEVRVGMIRRGYPADERSIAARQLGELSIGYLEQHGSVADLVAVHEMLEDVLRDLAGTISWNAERRDPGPSA